MLNRKLALCILLVATGSASAAATPVLNIALNTPTYSGVSSPAISSTQYVDTGYYAANQVNGTHTEVSYAGGLQTTKYFNDLSYDYVKYNYDVFYANITASTPPGSSGQLFSLTGNISFNSANLALLPATPGSSNVTLTASTSVIGSYAAGGVPGFPGLTSPPAAPTLAFSFGAPLSTAPTSANFSDPSFSAYARTTFTLDTTGSGSAFQAIVYGTSQLGVQDVEFYLSGPAYSLFSQHYAYSTLYNSVTVPAIPEPAPYSMLMAGIAGIALLRRRDKHQRASQACRDYWSAV